MKKLTKFLICKLLVFIQVQQINAQCIDTSAVSTNINNPVNTQFDISHPGQINPFLNTYNWSGVNLSGFQQISLNPSANWDAGYNTFLMNSPFSSAMSSDYDYLKYLENQIPHISRLNELDWSWERGWELMWMNTGYYPDGQQINNPLPNSILNSPIGLTNEFTPYIIVYNRYTGKMRLFANLITPFGSANNIYSTFRYGGQFGSGIFRNLNNFDRPLDMPTINLGATVYNKNDNNNSLWYSNDIQLSYDPCVCSYATDINLELKAIQNFDVKLYGRELQVEVPLNQIETDFLNQNSIEAGGAAGNNLIYKFTDKLYSDYQQQLADYNSKLKDYNNSQNTLKNQVLGITKDITLGVFNSAFPTSALKNLIIKNAITLAGKAFPDTTTALGWAKAAKEATKGLIGKEFDYLSQQSVLDKPTAPTMPTATLSEMRISGNITQSNFINITGLHTPGSFKPGVHALQANSYPIYNKPVGLFALLERPKLNIYENSSYNEFIYTINQGTFNESQRIRMLRSFDLRMKFADILKYKLNDAVAIDKLKTGTFVSFIIEYENDYTFNIEDYPINCNSPISGGMNVNSKDAYLMHHTDKNGLTNRTFETEWFPMSKLNTKEINLLFYDSIDADYSDISGCKYHNIYSSNYHNVKSIKMKIMNDMYFKDNPEYNTTQVFTYVILSKDNPSQETSSLKISETLNEFNEYNSGEVNISNEYIRPGHPYITKAIGNNLYIDAVNINLAGGVTVAPGYFLHLRSFNEISINPEIKMIPEVTIETVNSFSLLPIFKESTSSELVNYCDGINKKYSANILTLAKKLEDENTTKKELKSNQLGAYPNPVNTFLNIILTDKTTGVLVLYDLLGKQIYSQEITCNNKATLDVSLLPNGIFILKVIDGINNQTQKIIVQH